MCHVRGKPPYASVGALREMPEYTGGPPSLRAESLKDSVLGAWALMTPPGGRLLCQPTGHASQARGFLPRVSAKRWKGRSFQVVLLWGCPG